jgi:hypothetical protein
VRTRLTVGESEYLAELHRDGFDRARGFIYRKLGREAVAEFRFEDAWGEAMCKVAELIVKGEWDCSQEYQRLMARASWLCMPWYRKQRWMTRTKVVELTDELMLTLCQAPDPGSELLEMGCAKITLEAAIESIAKLKPSNGLYLHELIQLVYSGDDPTQTFHSGMVKRLQEQMAGRGIERSISTIKCGLWRARNELWDVLVGMGVLRGTRPLIDRKSATP